MEFIDIKNGYTQYDVEKVAGILKLGGVVVVPTDTVYGIAAASNSQEGIKKLYSVKGREYSKATSVLVSDVSMAKSISKGVSKEEVVVVKKFFPGPVTIILDKNDKVPDRITGGGDTVRSKMS